MSGEDARRRGAHAARRTSVRWSPTPAAERTSAPALRSSRSRPGHAKPGHAKPGRQISSLQMPSALTVLLLGLTGGGLSLIAVLPAGAADVATGRPQSISVSTPQDAGRDAPARASRSRPVLEAPPNVELRTVAAAALAAAAPEPEPAPAAAEADPVAPAPQPDKPAAPVLPGCDSSAVNLGRGVNGKLPGGVLCTLPGGSGERLRADAAVAFIGLATAYEQHFGKAICLTDGYRPLAEQQTLRRTKPRLAARPGYSEHGWGLAVDLSCGVQSSRSPQHAWLRENAQRFGWYLPDWARPGGAKPEPWHWEYDEKTSPRP